MRGFVYVIRAAGTNRYKIGRTTKNVRERLSDLQTGSPHELVVIECKEFMNCDTVERLLHDEFARYRINGEWFELNDVGPVVDRLRIWSSPKNASRLFRQHPWSRKIGDEIDDCMEMLSPYTQVEILRRIVIELVGRIHDIEQALDGQTKQILELEQELLAANSEINRLNGLSDGDNNPPVVLREYQIYS